MKLNSTIVYKLLILIPFILLSCSKDEEPSEQPINLTVEDLISSTWHIESFELDGNKMTIDECDAVSKITFSEGEIFITGAYWRDIDERDCYIFTHNHQFNLKGQEIKIEYDGGEIFYYARILNENTIEVSNRFNGSSFVRIYKR